MNETEFKLKHDYQPAKSCWNCFYSYGNKYTNLMCKHPDFTPDSKCKKFNTLPVTICDAWKFVKEFETKND